MKENKNISKWKSFKSFCKYLGSDEFNDAVVNIILLAGGLVLLSMAVVIFSMSLVDLFK